MVRRGERIGSRPADWPSPRAQATLGTGNLHEAVTLPAGEDCNEWLAVNTVRARCGSLASLHWGEVAGREPRSAGAWASATLGSLHPLKDRN